MKTTLETSERVLIENREENRRLNERNVSLNHELDKYRKTNDDLSSKLMAAESNIVNLERQILDQNLLQANHRDANRQEVLLKGIKVSSIANLSSLIRFSACFSIINNAHLFASQGSLRKRSLYTQR